MTITELIALLDDKLKAHGDILVFNRGWNDTGIVLADNVTEISVMKTGHEYDSEVIRVWEETTDNAGQKALLIQNDYDS